LIKVTAKKRRKAVPRRANPLLPLAMGICQEKGPLIEKPMFVILGLVETRWVKKVFVKT